MPEARTFIMAGGGTGGHVIPALAVACELRERGHRPVFIGTATGFEAKLVPQCGYPLEFIRIGGLNRVGAAQVIRSFAQLPGSVRAVFGLLERYRPAAIFSMGGYVAGPPLLAAWLRRLPIVVMEPNAVPGLTNRRMGRLITRALLSFPETERYFPKGRTEITGLPVRRDFFALPEKVPGDPITVLITGGSRGSRTLNEAARGAWQLLHAGGWPVRLMHQTGIDAYDRIAEEFAATGLDGEVLPFIHDMPAAFGRADIVVCRSGAGTLAELAAAGKPSILAPFPFASDDHQLRNAQAFVRAGASALVLDKEMNGSRLFSEIERFRREPERLLEMSRNARAFAHPGAASRAADVLEEVSHGQRRP